MTALSPAQRQAAARGWSRHLLARHTLFRWEIGRVFDTRAFGWLPEDPERRAPRPAA